jgi:hypothetical protein
MRLQGDKVHCRIVLHYIVLSTLLSLADLAWAVGCQSDVKFGFGTNIQNTKGCTIQVLMGQDCWSKASQANPHCDTDETLHGLEGAFTPKDAERIGLQRLRKAILAVVQQQYFAKIDDNWLAIIYQPISKAAAEHAQKRGLQDQAAAVPLVTSQQITMLRY